MDLQDSQAEHEFRTELRAWLRDAIADVPVAPPAEDWVARREYDTAWQRRLFDAGYAGVNWPRECGGRAATPPEQLIFLEETYRARAPDVGLNFIGTGHAGPTLIACGTVEQKATHLEPILRGDEIWCQGFSEPSAGSDLASLRTSAVRDCETYVINGRKVWTSYGHVADYCELLCRTNPNAPKHKGISWLIMPMDTAGVDVRTIKTITGSTEFCEVFLDDVRVPVANRVGPENAGWSVAMVTLALERGSALVGELLRTSSLFDDLVADAKKAAIWDAEVARRAGGVRAQLEVVWAMAKRNMTSDRSDGIDISGSIFKLAYTDARLRLDDFASELLGRAGLAFADRPTGLHDPIEERLRTLMVAIAGGTSLIQRNIVAERGLGLPRER
jgi:alkylation response protein AidB-like acyl-CoA dehydrogenase